jgi:hypothetical protein
MLLTSDFLKRWENIIEEVDKKHIPLDCVKKVIFRDTGRRQKTINLRRLRDQGVSEEELDKMIQSYIIDNESSMSSMEFVLDIEAVAGQIQPETDKLLKGM